MALRVLAAAAVLVSAVVHVDLWFDGVRDQDVIGELFLVNAVSGAVIAALLLAWRHWVPPFLAMGFGACTLAAFVISTTVGLFDVEASWEGWHAWTAAAAEVVAIVIGAALVLREGRVRSGGQSQHDASTRGAHLH